MRSMVAYQSGSVSRYFVGDPAAACHASGVRSQVSGLRKNLIIEDKGNKPDTWHLPPDTCPTQTCPSRVPAATGSAVYFPPETVLRVRPTVRAGVYLVSQAFVFAPQRKDRLCRAH